MTSYTKVFGADTVPPSGKTYRLISLVDHVQLYWPDNYEGPDFLASINNVTGSAANWRITMPPANEQSTGEDVMIRNVGLYAFQVNNFQGVPIATLQPGEIRYFYIMDNTTPAGVWGVVVFGSSTSAADASQLQGSGLTVVGSKLAASHPVTSLSASITVGTEDRAKIFAFIGGSNTLTLPSASDMSDNWFIGVRNAGTGSITIATTGVDKIDDTTSIVLAPGESLFIYCTGATYYTVGRGRSTQFQFTKLAKDVTAGGSFTLTSGEASNKLLQFTGAPSSNVTVNVPAVVSVYYVQNTYTGTATLTVKTASGTGVVLNSSDIVILFCDSVNVVAAAGVVNVGGGGGGSGTSAADGSVSAPGFNFLSDTNTGLWRISADTVGMSCGGFESTRWDDLGFYIQEGSLGINTLLPQASLDVRGMSIFSGGEALSGSLPYGTIVQVGAGDGVDTREMIDAYGGAGGPFLTLRAARGLASAPLSLNSGNALGTISWRGRTATAWAGERSYIAVKATENWSDVANGTKMLFATTPNNNTVAQVRIVINENGFVRIGDGADPARALDVLGSAIFTGPISGGQMYAVTTDSSFPLVATNNGGYHSMVQLRLNDSDVGYICADSTYPFKVLNSAGVTEVLRVDNAGVCNAASFVSISDERRKKDWADMPNDFLDKLAHVKHGKFTYSATEKRSVGVGAQSLRTIIPEAVFADAEGFLSVSYGNAALVACIELAKEVVSLKKQVSELTVK